MLDSLFHRFRWRSLWLLAVLMACFAGHANAKPGESCKGLQLILEQQQERLATLTTTLPALEALLDGNIADDFELFRIIDTPLDVESDVRAALKEQTLKQASLQPPRLPDAQKNCGDASTQWLEQANQLIIAERKLLEKTLLLLKSPKARRLALVRGTNQWLAIKNLHMAVVKWEAITSEQIAAKETLLEWISRWRSAVRAWLPALMQNNTNQSNLNTIWELCLSVPAPGNIVPWQMLLSGNDITTSDNQPTLAWLETSDEARMALRVEASKWRNDQLRKRGWGEFARELASPSEFLRHFSEEIEVAPRNLLDSVSRPFIREYRRAARTDNLGNLLTSWFLQTLGLISVFWLLLRLATYAPGMLAEAQRSLIEQFPNRVLAQITTALFWIIKPNAAWIVMLGGSALCSYLAEDDWYILRWAGPLGALYALMRAVRILLEWLISRSFTRSGQFVPSHIAEQQARDVRHTSWVVVVSWLSWWLIKATGGGYSFYLIALINMAVCWWILFWLLNRYPNQIARFLMYTIKAKAKTQDDLRMPLQWWVRIFWPGLFLLAHLLDIVVSANQKLMVFDSYRTLSVKLLRMRLDAIEEERDEDDDEKDAPDQSYSEWMLREPRSTETLLDIMNMDSVLNPVKQWHAERSDDNVLLIVGDQGSGKTTLVNRLINEWKLTPIKCISIPAKTLDGAAVMANIQEALGLESCNSIAELVSQDEQIEPQLIVIDAAHNMFMTEVGCLDAYRVFIQLMNAHLINVFWVVVMHAPSWTYLNCVFNREQRFSHVYRMPKWSPADIRKLILSRHQGSRRRLRYDELLLSASAGSESSSVRAADSRVFNIIWEQSAGNPTVALHLWLTAARTKDRNVEIGVPQKPTVASLNSLKDDLCFIYASIITHKSLSTSEIIEATNYPEPIVRHALKQGINLGLIHRDKTKRYSVHPVWQITLTGHLIRKNMLWTL